jgi:hypothetical protein
MKKKYMTMLSESYLVQENIFDIPNRPSILDGVPESKEGIGLFWPALIIGGGALATFLIYLKKRTSKIAPEQKEQLKQKLETKIETAKQKALSNPKNASKKSQIESNANSMKAKIKDL